jgi:hypothetical protein
MSWMTVSGLAVVNSVTIALTTVYDTQLFLAIRHHLNPRP